MTDWSKGTRESLEVDPHDYRQLIFHSNAKAMRWRGKVFLTNDAGANGYPYEKKKTGKNFNLCLVQYIKINLKLIIDLNVKLKISKLLEENIRKNLCDLGLGKGFLR